MTDVALFSLALGIIGSSGIILLLTLTGITFYFHRGCAMGNFRWHQRNLYLKQLSALACLFFLAMTASYAVLRDPWGVLYVLFALKTGTWWFRYKIL